jgi:predicted metal-dependent phosphoesterase TrpH
VTPKKLKVDFHTHTADDPEDYIDFSSEELIDRASALGYDALAITNHNIITDRPGLADYAEARGLLLIPGIELTLSGKHVVVVNPPFEQNPGLTALEELPRVRNDSSLVIAPHPFYPGFKCLWSKLTENIRWFDAVEFSFFYSRLINRNKPAVEVARASAKSLIGSSDCHNLWQVGFTYSLVEAEKNVPSIIAAVKAGKVEVGTSPLSLPQMVRIGVNFALGDRLHIHLRI